VFALMAALGSGGHGQCVHEAALHRKSVNGLDQPLACGIVDNLVGRMVHNARVPPVRYIDEMRDIGNQSAARIFEGGAQIGPGRPFADEAGERFDNGHTAVRQNGVGK